MSLEKFRVKAPRVSAKVSEYLFDQVAMAHRFIVRIDKDEYNLGTWSRVSGLRVSWGKHTYRPGNSNDELVLLGNISYDTIKLERAACSDSATVQRWLVETSRTPTALCGGIDMVDFANMPVVSWEIKQFFPISWSIGEFNSTGARPAIETLELAHTGFLDNEAKTS
ncbi:phage tail protein [Actinokineospora sp. 24-640]